MNAAGKKTLLLVEDETILALSERQELERYGYGVVVAKTGEEAARLGREDAAIDLILMDINLGPGIDGAEAARSILAVRDIPILFLSNHTEAQIVEKTGSISSYGYMVKNSSMTALDASIKMAFRLFYAERELREKKATLEAALDSMSDAVYITDRDGRFMEFNSACSSYHRFEKKETCPARLSDYPSFIEVYWPDGRPTPLEDWPAARALRGESATNVEYVLRRKDSGETWIGSYNFNPLLDQQGTIVGSVVVGRDISDSKRAEEQLREADVKLRKLVANIPDLVFQFTRRPDGSFYVPIASPGIRDIFGCSPEAVLEDFGPIARVLHPDDAARVIADIEYSAEHLSYFTCEFRVILPERGVQWIYSRSSPERLADGSVTWHGFNANITEKKLKEEETARTRALLQAAIESPQDLVIMAIDRDYRYLCFNSTHREAMRTAYGTDVEIGRSVLDYISAEADRANAKANYDRAFQGESHTTLQEYGDLNKTFFESLYNPIRNESGQIIGCTAFARDVTERRLIESKLREAQTRRDYVIEATHVGTWEWNVQTGETIFNEEWARMIGYTLAELEPVDIGTWERLCHPDDLPHSEDALRRHFRGDTPFYEADVRMRHRDGSLVWVHDRGCVMTRTADGAPLLMFGTHSDITARKRHEEELERSSRENRELLRELQHRAKNSFNMISALIMLSSTDSTSPETKQSLDYLGARVGSLSTLYDLLYSSGSFSELRLDEYCSEIASSLLGQGGAIRLNLELDALTISVKDATSIGLILTELVTNAIKYAFPEGRAGMLTVSLRAQAARDAVLEVRDDGIGLPPGFDLADHAGMGFNLVQALALQISGTFTVSSDAGGTRCAMRFPLSPP